MTLNREAIVQRAAELRAAGGDWDSVLKKLRDEDFSKIDCIVAIREIEMIPLGEAKEMVHFSPAWEDRREQDDQFHDDLIDAVQKIDWDDEV